MKVYHLKRTQILPITLQHAWDFFSTPDNLAKITPPHMGFKILYQSGGDKAYAGQIIRYKLSVLPGIKVHWMTEITQVKEPQYFIDEQRFGPYALWHHQHHFREVENGVEMTDEVSYAIPLGVLGRLAHALFVGREVNRIFDFRTEKLKQIFPSSKS
ncbi:MAG: SRPBCC family protein [Bacteroidetes bacterium]|nr:SRPBCC family protein [Bacteroidota bacterium]